MTEEKYCCFLHPKNDYTLKQLDDVCPDCGKPYGFVLSHPPERVGQYRIFKKLGRGFYGATYIAERGQLKAKYVIKLTPISFYSFFKKGTFAEECETHNRLAEGTSHIIKIIDYFDENVTFSDSARTVIPCHVTELEYVEGPLLSDFLSGERPASARAVAQIAVDLLRIRGEFEAKQLYHNDLHAKNLIIEQLKEDTRRIEAIDDRIKLRVIDLGSVADESKSDSKEKQKRAGDLEWIATHIEALLEKMLKEPESLDDRDYRIALALQSVIHAMAGDAENRRHPNPEDLVGQINEEFRKATQPWRPWRENFSLRTFGAHYNAQTLDPWDAPQLFVDQGEWLQQVTKPGPQIVTGMRGCGKTLLLRSMEFHARAAIASRKTGDSKKLASLLAEDGFVGLFASAQRLLDLKRDSLVQTEHRLTRLLLSYGLQAVRAISHLVDLDKTFVEKDAHAILADGIGAYVDASESLAGIASLVDLETRLERLVVKINRDPGALSVKAAAAQVFPKLAASVKRCSPLWNRSVVLFLLDDVSTRYLEVERIAALLSSLVFNDPACAFKLSSEWQTIELGLQSPGRMHPIRIDRDVAVFDLGSEVNRVINARDGVDFVERVLLNRAQHHPGHPHGRRPRDLLGDRSLIDLARAIAGSTRTAADRKDAYWGLTCLASVCVGDIGDVIKLYDKILGEWDEKTVPVPASRQSDCFHSLSSQRLFELNRRGGYFKDAAKTFAEASHELLVRSHRDLKQQREKKERLREYSSVYVRVTTASAEARNQQIDRLRELVDAGVFVFTGGLPRTKTKDSDPILQFKLTYRKIYGLTSLIGLAERDRFELSGTDLETWLEHPENGREILLRNLGTEEGVGEARVVATAQRTSSKGNAEGAQQTFELVSPPMPELNALGKNRTTVSALRPKPAAIAAKEIDLDQLSKVNIGSAVVGLGFETRALESSKLLADRLRIPQVYAVRYRLPGYADAVLGAWKRSGASLNVVDYDPILNLPAPNSDGSILIDVSGLSKPIIFSAIRNAISRFGRVYIAYGRAATYYPTPEEIRGLMVAQSSGNNYNLLERLGEILKGEVGPYESVGLLANDADQTRKRALIAFASPKHERIFRLLDDRDFDEIEVVCPSANTPRTEISRLAGDVIAQTKPNARKSLVDSDDLCELISHCDSAYLRMYAEDGANVEIGLTGSKLQAVAIAALSTQRKFSQAWYVKPAEFDESRFSEGFSVLRLFELIAS